MGRFDEEEGKALVSSVVGLEAPKEGDRGSSAEGLAHTGRISSGAAP